MVLDQALKNAYFQALSGIGYPVYNAYAVPENASYPYVIISQIDINQIQISGCKKWGANVTIDIVTGFDTPSGSTQANTIADLIENIVNPDSMDDLSIASPYRIGETRNTLSRNIEARNDTKYVYRNIRTYQHIVGLIG